MDIRSIKSVTPVKMHETAVVWGLIPKFSVINETKSTYLESVEEWTLAAGRRARPHFHNSHEYHYILDGEAVVQIEQEARRVARGDLVYIPPNAVHMINAVGSELRGLTFAASYQVPGEPGYTEAELEEVPVAE